MYETSSVDGSTSTTHSILIQSTLAGDKNKISIKRVQKSMRGNPEDPSHLSLFGPQWHYYGKSDC